jgi:hypothetical protein
MTALDEVRRTARSLPEATGRDHHQVASLRVGARIVATVPEGGHARVMVDQAAIRAVVAEFPGTCGPLDLDSSPDYSSDI